MGGCFSEVALVDAILCGGCPTFSDCFGVYQPLPDADEQHCQHMNTTTDFYCQVNQARFRLRVIVPLYLVTILGLLWTSCRRSSERRGSPSIRRAVASFPVAYYFFACWVVWCFYELAVIIALVATTRDLLQLTWSAILTVVLLAYMCLCCCALAFARRDVKLCCTALFGPRDPDEPLMLNP